MPLDQIKERQIKMDTKTYTTGVQHVGIPTNNIEETIAFGEKLGFEKVFETINEAANEKVAFLKHGTLDGDV